MVHIPGPVPKGSVNKASLEKNGPRKPDITHCTNNWLRDECADRLGANPLEFLIKLEGQSLDV